MGGDWDVESDSETRRTPTKLFDGEMETPLLVCKVIIYLIITAPTLTSPSVSTRNTRPIISVKNAKADTDEIYQLE